MSLEDYTKERLAGQELQEGKLAPQVADEALNQTLRIKVIPKQLTGWNQELRNLQRTRWFGVSAMVVVAMVIYYLLALTRLFDAPPAIGNFVSADPIPAAVAAAGAISSQTLAKELMDWWKYTGNYERDQKLGGGLHGNVFTVKDHPGEVIKIIRDDRVFAKEVDTMRKVQGHCNNPIKLIDAGTRKEDNYILMSKMPDDWQQLSDAITLIQNKDDAVGFVRELNDQIECFYKRTGHLHTDLHDKNVWYNPQTKQVRLLDWSYTYNKRNGPMKLATLERVIILQLDHIFSLQETSGVPKEQLVKFLTWPVDLGFITEAQYQNILRKFRVIPDDRWLRW